MAASRWASARSRAAELTARLCSSERRASSAASLAARASPTASSALARALVATANIELTLAVTAIRAPASTIRITAWTMTRPRLAEPGNTALGSR